MTKGRTNTQPARAFFLSKEATLRFLVLGALTVC